MRFFFLYLLLISAGHLYGQTIKLDTGNQGNNQLLIIETNGSNVLIDSKGNVQDKGLPFGNSTRGNAIHYDIHGRVSRIGDDRVEYDIHSRVNKVGIGSYFLLLKLIEKYNSK